MKYLYLIIIFTFTIVSCSEMNTMEYLNEDITYLSLPDDTNFSKLSPENIRIVSKAITRLKIYEDKNGLMKFNAKSGKDIKVSDNIYTFITSVVDKANKQLISEAGLNRNGLISRSESNDYFRRTDCFAWAIATATSYTYEQVSSELYNQYGANGVPLSAATYILTSYGNTSVFSTTSASYDLGPNYIVILRNSNGTYHAVTGVALDGSYVQYMDYQSSVEGDFGISNRDNIERIYYITDYPW